MRGTDSLNETVAVKISADTLAELVFIFMLLKLFDDKKYIFGNFTFEFY